MYSNLVKGPYFESLLRLQLPPDKCERDYSVNIL